jgi:NAD(P)-dependent dehydrogenase (short-subunit alcohol dehydrogenase family)
MQRGLGTVFGKVAVVTGAASGIGRATAELLSRLGASVALVDRNRVGLERVGAALSPGPFALVEAELSRADQVSAAVERVGRELGAADLLVNAAGVAVLGGLLEASERDLEELVTVNVGAMLLVTRAFARAMVARGRGGQIVNVSSAAAFFTPKEIVPYGVTKYAAFGLSQGLDAELREHGISVSCVCPGFVDTPIVEHMRVAGPDAERRREQARRFYRARGLTADRVARAIVKAAERGTRVVPVGFEAYALQALSRIAPGVASRAFAFGERLMATRGNTS